MKFYIASRLKHKREVKELIKKLHSIGLSCTHDWTEGERLKPYRENLNQSQKVAKDQLEAIKEADIFVLLMPDEGGTGMYVELGAALAWNTLIFVVGEFKKPIFLYHPQIQHVSNTEDLLKKVSDI